MESTNNDLAELMKSFSSIDIVDKKFDDVKKLKSYSIY